MLLEVFGMLTVVSLFLVALGYFVETKVLSTVGFFFLFLLSFMLINGTLEHKTGEVMTPNTGTNGTTTTYSYSQVGTGDSIKTYGIYLAILSGVGISLSLIFNKGGARN